MFYIKQMHVRFCVMFLLCAYSTLSHSSTFVTADLDSLTKHNSEILVGKVKDVSSYWNSKGSFIFTDVTIIKKQDIKGSLAKEFTITLMGGSVGGTTAIIVGGPELSIGKEYVLFLNAMDMPGKTNALTIKEHAQGIFDLVEKNGEMRAISQATKGGVSLIKNSNGKSAPPGNIQGVELLEFISLINQNKANTRTTK